MLNRYSVYKFKNGASSPNRVVIPPMASQTTNPHGLVPDKTVEHCRRLAQSEAGIIFVEYTFVHPTGRGEANQLGAVTPDQKILSIGV